MKQTKTPSTDIAQESSLMNQRNFSRNKHINNQFSMISGSLKDSDDLDFESLDKKRPTSSRVYGTKSFKNPFQASNFGKSKKVSAKKKMHLHLPRRKSHVSKNSSGKFSFSSCSIVEEDVTTSAKFDDNILKADSFEKFSIKEELFEYDDVAGGKCVVVASVNSGTLKSE